MYQRDRKYWLCQFFSFSLESSYHYYLLLFTTDWDPHSYNYWKYWFCWLSHFLNFRPTLIEAYILFYFRYKVSILSILYKFWNACKRWKVSILSFLQQKVSIYFNFRSMVLILSIVTTNWHPLSYDYQKCLIVLIFSFVFHLRPIYIELIIFFDKKTQFI